MSTPGTSGPPEPTTTGHGGWGGEGHVIVCGLRGVGLRTVEQLHQSGVAVVVVDDDPDLRRARIIEGWGVTHIHRSAQLGDGLAEAGLDRASAVICVETNELATLEIAMRVREARPDVRLVVQLATPSVGRALERVLGTGTVLDVAALAAPSFVEVCLRQPSHQVELGGERFAVVEVEVGADTAANGNETEREEELLGGKREMTWHVHNETTLFAWRFEAGEHSNTRRCETVCEFRSDFT